MGRYTEKQFYKEYAQYLELTDDYTTGFKELVVFLSAMKAREIGREITPLPFKVIKRILTEAGGHCKRVSFTKIKKVSYGKITKWNLKPKFELPPTVLLPLKPSSYQLRKQFQSRKVSEETRNTALEFLNKLKREGEYDYRKQ